MKENQQLQAELSHLAGNAGKVRDDTSYDASKEGNFPDVIVRSGFQTYSLKPKSIAILQKSIPPETQTDSTPA